MIRSSVRYQQWISKYAVQAYTTADRVVLYLIHAQIAWTTVHRRLLNDARL